LESAKILFSEALYSLLMMEGAGKTAGLKIKAKI